MEYHVAIKYDAVREYLMVLKHVSDIVKWSVVYIEVKTEYSINGVGKFGQIHSKN